MLISKIESKLTGNLFEDLKGILKENFDGTSLSVVLHDRKPQLSIHYLSGKDNENFNRFAVKLYDTIILWVFQDGRIVLNSHNVNSNEDFKTVTTKRWINRFILPSNFRLYQKENEWYVWSIENDEYAYFQDGLMLFPDGGAMFLKREYVTRPTEERAIADMALKRLLEKSW